MPNEQPDYNNSILNSVKKSLGIIEYEFYDPELILHINTVFADLNQIGVGPEVGYSITDATNLWSEFTENDILLNNVKSYMFLRVKLLFDPPTASTVLASYEKQISELVYRMYIYTDNKSHPVEGGLNHE